MFIGFIDGIFGEHKAISRQQAYFRMLRYVDVDTTLKENVELADMNLNSDYAKPTVEYLVFLRG